MKRKPIPKEIRQQVYEKYNGHCAYCGCKLEYKDMQVDHIRSVYRSECADEDVDNSIDNLMPACRQCNFYKSDTDIEGLRRKLINCKEKYLMSNFYVRLGLRYGMLLNGEWNKEFYFEKQERYEHLLSKKV